MKNKNDDLIVEKEEVKKISGLKNTLTLLKKAQIKKSTYCWIVLLYAISAVMAVFHAYLTACLTKSITQANFDNFVMIVLLFGVVSMLKMTFQNFQYIFNVKLENLIVKSINTKNYNQVLSLEISNFNDNSSEEFQNRIYAANQISSIIISVLTNIYEIIHNLAYTIIIFIYAPILSLIYAIYPICKIIYNKIMTPKFNALYNKNWKENGIKMTALSREAIIGVKDIKSLNMNNQIIKDYKAKQDAYYEQQNKINTYSIKTKFFMSAIVSLSDIVTFLAGYLLYKYANFSIVSFVLFLSYKGYIRQLFDQFSNLISCVSNVEANSYRGNELYNDKKFSKEKFGNKKLNNIKGDIEIKNLNFSYENKTKLFKNLSLKIEPNQITAIVGRSGEGKSTILSLINKFYSVDDNKIFLDGVDINQLEEKSIRSNIVYIQQSPYIFNMTFRENLLLVNPKATKKELIDACQKSEIYNFIMSTPNGLDTMIGENGIKLSGGQKQRLAIARALLNKAKIIMFDESTSSLDNESQLKIQKVIERLSSNHTIIVVAHRLSTIINANKIIYLKGHKVKDIGTHKELMGRCEDYKNIYKVEIVE